MASIIAGEAAGVSARVDCGPGSRHLVQAEQLLAVQQSQITRAVLTMSGADRDDSVVRSPGTVGEQAFCLLQVPQSNGEIVPRARSGPMAASASVLVIGTADAAETWHDAGNGQVNVPKLSYARTPQIGDGCGWLRSRPAGDAPCIAR